MASTRVQSYLDALVQTYTHGRTSLVSIVLFGSAAKGGFADDVSDVDVIVVTADDLSRARRRQLGAEIARLEIEHGLRAEGEPSAARARVERAVGHGMSCFVCTRSDLLSGDVARVLDLSPFEAPFVDRIVFASIIASAVTVWGENLVPRVPVPSVRRLDVFKALFGFSSQVFLSVMTFPVLPHATKYAMGALKHSLHSCYFCYHGRTATLEEEAAFLRTKVGPVSALSDLLALRAEYHRSFAFVIGCVPALVRLHLRTARDNGFQ
jgi:predicted nucleotidyltransferase